MYSSSKTGGISILGLLVLGFILIVVLSHFNISIKEEVQNPTTQDNLNYVGGATTTFWGKYIAGPVNYIWNKIFIPYIWNPFADAMNSLRTGQNSEMQNIPLIPKGASE
ncbi:hypothetical protein K2P96_02075 [Patescibacteria group bacterium]|nr:hypothetical protein [Patescibacteria group bacterium]